MRDDNIRLSSLPFFLALTAPGPAPARPSRRHAVAGRVRDETLESSPCLLSLRPGVAAPGYGSHYPIRSGCRTAASVRQLRPCSTGSLACVRVGTARPSLDFGHTCGRVPLERSMCRLSPAHRDTSGTLSTHRAKRVHPRDLTEQPTSARPEASLLQQFIATVIFQSFVVDLTVPVPDRRLTQPARGRAREPIRGPARVLQGEHRTGGDALARALGSGEAAAVLGGPAAPRCRLRESSGLLGVAARIWNVAAPRSDRQSKTRGRAQAGFTRAAPKRSASCGSCCAWMSLTQGKTLVSRTVRNVADGGTELRRVSGCTRRGGSGGRSACAVRAAGQ